MKQRFNIADFFILLFVICDVKDIVREGDILGVISLALILIISLYAAYQLLSRRIGGGVIKSLTVLMLMFIIYGLAVLLSGTHFYVTHGDFLLVNNRTYLKDISKSLMPFYAFYYFSYKGLLTEKKLKKWVAVFFVVTSATFFTKRAAALIMAMDTGAVFTDSVTVNAGYLVLGLLPCLTLFREKKILFYSALGYCTFLTIYGMKRGAIIITGICLVFILFSELKESTIKEKVWVLLLSIVFIVVIAYYFYSQFMNSAYMQYQIERTMGGDTSSRDNLLGTMMNHYLNDDNIIHILFGLGANGTLTIADNFAHNDWMEILINQGAIGVLIYFCFWICLIKEWRRSKRVNDAFFCITIFVIICFMKTLFSMSYSFMQYYTTLMFCFYLVKVHNNESVTCNQLSEWRRS